MPRSSNQKLKLLYLAKIFFENTDAEHPMTLKELSAQLAKYEISAERKSLYNDIELLRVFGMDICVIRDRSVRYYVGKHTFELSELRFLADAVLCSAFITEKKSASIIKKLRTLCSRHEAQALVGAPSVSRDRKAVGEEIFCNVNMIHRAISENRRICFRYFEWNTEKKRVLLRDGEFFCISPWALTGDDRNYYMIGFDEKESTLKSYRVDKMLEIYVDAKARSGEKDFYDFAAANGTCFVFGAYVAPICNVRLSCDNSLADAILDRFGTDIVIARFDDRFEFTAKVTLNDQFYSYLLGFGDRIKVVYPPIVAETLTQKASSVLKNYGDLC